jgi:diketogulonate reductase-like aldo/keto reductase
MQALEEAGAVADVQNPCFARAGWDRAVRAFCHAHDMVYQGFSLLTANPEALRDRTVTRAATRLRASPAQVVFRFAASVGILPLTGTSDPEHMAQDLASRDLQLTDSEIGAIESLAG